MISLPCISLSIWICSAQTRGFPAETSINFFGCMRSCYLLGQICNYQVKLEGEINQGIAYYKKALYYNWRYADAMYNLGVAYGEMLKFEMVHMLINLSSTT